MARKRRWDSQVMLGSQAADLSQQAAKQGPCPTAAYVRLSVEDSGKADGDSLENQETLLRDYIYNHPELRLYRVYTDNGYSGTQFHRPAFEEMMEAARKGSIGCIVVKDLSRLGRNYLEAGNYLEQVFPFLGVRFISVNDGYDSQSASHTDQTWMLPLKNIINESYARDISRKVSSAMAARKAQGKFLNNYPPYGYCKDPEDKNHLVPDPQTAPMVARIFSLRRDGISLSGIARQLNQEEIPCPSRLWWERGLTQQASYEKALWDRTSVGRLLANRTYLGCVVYGKSRSQVGKGKTVAVPPAQWQMVEHCHQPLVERELFEEVQRSLEESSRAFRDKVGVNPDYQPENLYRGLIRCANCGKAMKMTKYVRTTPSGKKRHYAVYSCQGRDKLGKGFCPMQGMVKSRLDQAVAQSIRYHMETFLDQREMQCKLRNTPARQGQEKWLQQQIQARQQRIEKLEGMHAGMYQDYRDGLLDQEEYRTIRAKHNQELQQLREELEGLKAQCTGPQAQVEELEGLVEQYRNFSTLTREIVEAFVADILVHTGKRVTVVFRMEDPWKALEPLREEGER